MELVIQRGTVERSVPMVATVTVGRASSNDIVIADESLSSHHAIFWIEAGRPWVRDLGSRNGTFMNDQPVSVAAPIDPGSTIRMGSLSITVRGPFGQHTPLLLEEVATGLAFRVPARGLTIGPDFPADIRVPGCQPCEVHPYGGALEIRAPYGDRIVNLGETLVLGRSEFRVMPMRIDTGVTQGNTSPPYTLHVAIDPPRAVLANRVTRDEVVFTAENRVTLLYVLAQAPLGVWIPTYDVIVGVWGRLGKEEGLRRLSSLVFRMREAARKANLDDAWLLRSPGGVRLDVQQMECK